MFELDLETERVKGAWLFLGSGVSSFRLIRRTLRMQPVKILSVYFAAHLVVIVVGDIVAVSIPANFICVSFLLRVKQRLHAVIELRIRLHKIDYVEDVFSLCPCIINLKIEPLGEVFRLIIRLQNKLIFTAINLYGFL